jgi:hypothetical protein
MSLFADPRAIGARPMTDGEILLVDREMRPIATAVEYDGWWGVCSLRSRIPVSRRAANHYEAMGILFRTVWSQGQPTDQEEYASFDKFARAGSLYIRSLLDDELLEAARDNKSPAWHRISAWIGEGVNPHWITDQCAEEAYGRGLINGQELDWITR